MKKLTVFVAALALTLGLAQCKKEQVNATTENETELEGVRITLNVDGGSSNSRVIVNPTGHTNPDYATVTFEEGDVIYVGNNGVYRGYLTYGNGQFSGNIDDSNLSTADYLHFYFLGNKGTTSEPTSVSITDQTSKYPVISYAHSTALYNAGTTAYSAKLQNYCGIVKFTTTGIDAANAITITGMNNTVAVNFNPNNGEPFPYTFSKSGDGEITLHAECISRKEICNSLALRTRVTGGSPTTSGTILATTAKAAPQRLPTATSWAGAPAATTTAPMPTRPLAPKKKIENFYAYGNESYNLYDSTGKADWGYNVSAQMPLPR